MQEIQPYIPYIIYAGIALVALVVLVLLLRAFGRRSRGRKGQRLGIVEYCEVDQTRRLVLLRRDDVEHLVLIGGNQDLLVEGHIGIEANATRPHMSMQPTLDHTQSDDILPIRPPRAPVFGAARRPVLRPVNYPGEDDPHSA